MRPGTGSFPGVTCSPDAKPAPFGAAGKTVDQYPGETLAERALPAHTGVGSKIVKTGIPVKFCHRVDALALCSRAERSANRKMGRVA